MNVKQFTENNQVVNLILDLKERFIKHNVNTLVVSDTISDAVDDSIQNNELQYVDLVQEGGGILGIALLGYTYALEEMGIRFMSLGGTSAGAINSLLMAACDKPEEKKTVKLLKILSKVKLQDFIDGDSDAQDFIQTFMKTDSESKGIKKWGQNFLLGYDAVQVIDNFRDNQGLNPGEVFKKWLEKELRKVKIKTIAQLEDRMRSLPGSIRIRTDKGGRPLHKFDAFKPSVNLAIVAAEVTTETKVIFPEMAELFYENPAQAPPADFVRASMSIPLFFEPFRKDKIPKGPEIQKNWRIGSAGYTGAIPDEAIFVDGGVMSNFPIDVFHKMEMVPPRPTFGIKLGLERNKINEISGVFDLLYASFNAARNHRDFEFVTKNKDFKHLVGFIDVEGMDWLDFEVNDETKVQLFIQGVKAAKDFLEKFNWSQYKKVRREKAKTRKSHENAIKDLGKRMTTICQSKEQHIDPVHISTIDDRLYHFGKNIKLKALWIDDYAQNIKKEISIFEELGIKIILKKSSEEAKKYINQYGDSIDIVISDISRDGNIQEGTDFAKWLYQFDPDFRNKLIFYISNYDISRGKPAFSFGITNSFVELFHIVLDIAQRNLYVETV